jgi:hypothetical protein
MNPDTKTPDELSMMQAAMEGQRAGQMSHGASMNPYQDNTREHAEWERCRMATIGSMLNRIAA